MIIRELNYSDKKMTQHFFDEMGEKSTSFFNVNHGNEKRTMEFFENGKTDHKFFIATDENKILGLSFIWDINLSIPWFGIAVGDKYQGQGIGTKLTEFVFAYAEAHGFGGIFLRTAKDNMSAQRLYEKCGFERIGVHPSGEYLYIKRWKNNG